MGQYYRQGSDTLYITETPEKDMNEVDAAFLAMREQKAAEAAFKATRAAAVRAIKVIVNGMEFDGDEDAQSRMSRAIMAAKTLQSPVIPLWKLADNSTANNIAVADLEMALALSVVAMAEVWV